MIVALRHRPTTPESQRMLWIAGWLSVATVLGVALTARGALIGAIGLIAIGGVALIALTAWRPAVGFAILVLAVPLTAGLGRNTVVPIARTNELVTVLVALGLLLRYLPKKSRVAFTWLDLAVAAYCISGVIVPALVLFIGHEGAGFDVWRVVFAPAQYLLIYLVFSRSGLSGRSLTAIVNLTLVASVVVATVGLAQLADLPGVRAFIAGYFPMDGTGEAICQLGVCRPDSLLEHWSAFGGYALMNFILALALVARRHPAFNPTWLGIVMAANAVAVLASQTQAVIIALILVTPLILWQSRRIPRQLLIVAAALMLSVAVFWPEVSARIEQQFSSIEVGGSSPTSLQTRFRFWDAYFLPVIADHIWTGTGTVIPSEVPSQLDTFVDNEYLRLAFRAGLIGVAALVLMLVATGVAGWRSRGSPEPLTAALGAAALGYTVALTVMGATGEYLTYAGIAQQFWMIVGLFAGALMVQHQRRPLVATVIDLSRPERPAGSFPQAAVLLGRLGTALAPERRFLRSSAIVLAGNSTARFLGLAFSVVAARLLLPSGYGVFAYALAVANIAALLVGQAQQGLSRALSRDRGDADEQSADFSNWLAFAVIVLGLSLVLAIPLSLVAGLRGWLLAGVAANLVGIAVLQFYREAQRGLERYGPMVLIYLLANVIQLVAVGGLALTRHRSPAGFLIAYGLSSLVALMPMQLLTPLKVRFARYHVSPARIRAIRRFVGPLFLQTAFFSIWISADLILVNRLMSSSAAGGYAAAKTAVNSLMLVSTAVTVPLAPRVASLPLAQVARYVRGLLRMTAVLTVPIVVILIAFAGPLVALVFGRGYARTAGPLPILSVGMGLYALYTVLEWTWIARGRPTVDALATGVGMLLTVATGVILVPRAGLVGAAIAFTIGAAAQLAVIGAISLWWLRRFETAENQAASSA